MSSMNSRGGLVEGLYFDLVRDRRDRLVSLAIERLVLIDGSGITLAEQARQALDEFPAPLDAGNRARRVALERAIREQTGRRSSAL